MAGFENLYLYADNLKVFDEIKSENDIEELQEHLDRLYGWTHHSLLRFHPDKCVTMRFGSNLVRQRLVSSYNMDEIKLNRSWYYF